MKRYIILYNNGHLVQQDGLNTTYVNMFDIGVIKMIIDTTEGKVVRGDEWGFNKISSFSSSDLVIESNIKP
jgi:hypothetical protein